MTTPVHQRIRIDIVSIFGEYLAPLRLSLLGRAQDIGLVEIAVHDLRSNAVDVHRTVDDAPFGGGPGMVMTPQPWLEAMERIVELGRVRFGDTVAPIVLVPTPSGHEFTQRTARELSGARWLVILCGRYEGIDDRVLAELGEHYDLRPLSIGDYVLAGGEVAALVMIEAITRLIPGVLGNAGSIVEESHANGLLEYPAYTRPAVWRGRRVPDVLISGDHAKVARWRRDESIRRTAARRPDLLRRVPVGSLDAADIVVLAGLGWRLGADGPEPG